MARGLVHLREVGGGEVYMARGLVHLREVEGGLAAKHLV